MTNISTEDQLAINELIASYSHLIDSGEAIAWSKLFTEQAELKTPVGNAHGREAIYLWAKNRIDQRDPDKQTRHFVTNTLLTRVNENTVAARSMLLLTTQSKVMGEPANVLATSIYMDTVSKVTNDRGKTHWLFSKRETDIHLDLDSAFLSSD